MLNLTPQQTGDLLAKWLLKAASVDVASNWGREVGYGDSPLFGPARRHSQLFEEVALLHGAIAIFAVGHALPNPHGKAVVEAFAALAQASLFPAFEQHDPAFKGRWVERRARYTKLLQADRQAVAASIAFMHYLELDPLRNLEGQVRCAARISQAVVDAQGVLGHVRLKRPRSAQDAFEERIRDWPAPQADSALRLFRALRDGRVEEAGRFYDRLTVAQSRAVHEALDELVRASQA